MGTDIHAVFQKKTDDGWQDIEHKYKEDRHYFLFAWLADVRNGFGFAGVPTHKPVKPITERRGLPDDFVMDGECHPVASKELLGSRGEWFVDGEPLEFWLGDHSHSWLTADEILAAPRPLKLWRTGIVGIEFFNAWDGCAEPETWSGGISGPDILVAESPTDVTDESTHVRIWWMADDGLDYFINEIRRLKDEHGEVRMVFGFDS